MVVPARWLGVELRHLAALKTVAEQGSFVRAAHELGYSQPAISQQISALERMIGERLLDRSPGSNRISLTRAGSVFLRHADVMIRQIQAADADLATPG